MLKVLDVEHAYGRRGMTYHCASFYEHLH